MTSYETILKRMVIRLQKQSEESPNAFDFQSDNGGSPSQAPAQIAAKPAAPQWTGKTINPIFQKMISVAPDGKLGEKTRAALEAYKRQKGNQAMTDELAYEYLKKEPGYSTDINSAQKVAPPSFDEQKKQMQQFSQLGQETAGEKGQRLSMSPADIVGQTEQMQGAVSQMVVAMGRQKQLTPEQMKVMQAYDQKITYLMGQINLTWNWINGTTPSENATKLTIYYGKHLTDAHQKLLQLYTTITQLMNATNSFPGKQQQQATAHNKGFSMTTTSTKKNNRLLQKVELFEKLSLYGDRGAFLKSLSQAQGLTPQMKQLLASLIDNVSALGTQLPHGDKVLSALQDAAESEHPDMAALSSLVDQVSAQMAGDLKGPEHQPQVEQAQQLAAMLKGTAAAMPETEDQFSSMVPYAPGYKAEAPKPPVVKIDPKMQEALGFKGPDVDGIFGPKTRAALENYKQKKNPGMTDALAFEYLKKKPYVSTQDLDPAEKAKEELVSNLGKAPFSNKP